MAAQTAQPCAREPVIWPSVYVRPAEMAKMQLEEKKEWEKVYDEDEKVELSAAVTLTEDGRQRNNPGQYL